MAFAIATGAATFEFLGQVVRPRLPLDEGDRIVAIRNWGAAAGQAERQVLHDFVRWRDQVETLGAYRTLDRNLATDDGRSEPIEVAEISALAFRLTRVPPRLGRTPVEAGLHARVHHADPARASGRADRGAAGGWIAAGCQPLR